MKIRFIIMMLMCFFVYGCGSEDEDERYESDSLLSQGLNASQVMQKMREAGDQACGCKDSVCAEQAVRSGFSALFGNVLAFIDEDPQMVQPVVQRLGQCAGQAGLSSARWLGIVNEYSTPYGISIDVVNPSVLPPLPNSNNSGNGEKIAERFADQVCQCVDTACAQSSLGQYMDYMLANPNATNGNPTLIKTQSERMVACARQSGLSNNNILTIINDYSDRTGVKFRLPT